FVQRRRGQRGEQAKNGQPCGPSADFLECPLRETDGVVVRAENERGDGVNVALGKALEHGGIFAWFVEALVYVRKVRGIDGFHADENPFAAGGGDEVDEFLVAQEIGADLRDPMDLRAGGDDVAQQR